MNTNVRKLGTRTLALLLALVTLFSLFSPVLAAENETGGATADAVENVTQSYVDEVGNPIADPQTSASDELTGREIDGYFYTGYEEVTTYVYSTIHRAYIMGYPDGSVQPEGNLTRAEAAMIFYRLYDGEVKVKPTAFKDLEEDAWYYDAIVTLENAGIATGYDDGTYKPGQAITRAEFAVLTALFDNLEPVDGRLWSDVPKSHWALTYINAATEAGWIDGYPDGTFRADKKITRAEVVKLTNSMLGQHVDLADLPKDVNPYGDITEKHWAYCDIMEASIKHSALEWHGTDYETVNQVITRYVDDTGDEIAETETDAGKRLRRPPSFDGYNYTGYIKEITYQYSNAFPMPTLTKTASQTEAQVGDTITYTITASNSEDAKGVWKNITLKDQLSEYLEFDYGTVYVDGESKSHAWLDGAVIVKLGDLAPGESATVTFMATILETAKVTARAGVGTSVSTMSYGKTIYNVAVAESDNHEPVEDGDDGVQVAAGEIKPYASKIPNTTKAKVGDTVVYSITVGNDESATAVWENVTFTDAIPEGMSFVYGSLYVDGKSAVHSMVDGQLQVELGDIAPGESVYLIFQATVDDDTYGQTIYNVAVLEGDNSEEPLEAPDEGIQIDEGKVRPYADKTASVDTADIGDTITYTINLGNRAEATDTWENATFADVIPEQLTFVDGSVYINNKATSDYTFQNNTLKLELGDIKAGDSMAVTFRATIDAGTYGQVVYNTAILTGDNTGNDTEATDEGVYITDGETGPYVVKSADVDQAEAGDTVTYAIRVGNSQGAEVAWENVRITDQIPDGMTFIDGSVYINGESVDYSFDKGILTVAVGDIQPGESLTVIFRARINDDVFDEMIYNTVTAKGSNGEEQDTDDGVYVTDGETGPYVFKAVSRSLAKVGDNLTYTITVGNSKGADVAWQNAAIEDPLPDDVTFVHGSVQVDGMISNDYGFVNGVLKVELGDIAPGKTVRVTFEVTVNDDAFGKTIYNTAVAKGDNLDDPLEDTDGGVYIAEGTVEPFASKKATDGRSQLFTAEVGDIITYSVEVGNDRWATVGWEKAVMTDKLSSYLTFQHGSVQVNGRVITTYGYTGNVLTVDLGDIAPGETLVVTYDAMVNSTAFGETIYNTAELTGDNCEKVSADDEGVEIGVGNSWGHAVKTSSVDYAEVGDIYTYTIELTNATVAQSNWLNVVVADTIPDWVTFVRGSVTLGGQSTNSFNYNDSTRLLTVNVGDISTEAGNNTKVVTFEVQVNEGAQGQFVTNTAYVESSNNAKVVAPDRGVEIGSGTAMPSATKKANVTALEVGETVTYTIELKNDITATANWQNIVINDVLPDGFTFIHSSVYVNGVSHICTLSGNAVTIKLGDLVPGQSMTVTLQGRAAEDGTARTWRNVATITGDNTDQITVTDDGVFIEPDEVVAPNTIYGSKAASKTQVTPGETFTYTVIAGNDSENDWTWYNVQMSDILETSYLYLINDSVKIDGRYANSAEFSYSNKTLTVQLGHIAPGAQVVVTFDVGVKNNAYDQVISNSATLKGSNQDGGSYNATIRTSSKTPVEPPPDDRDNSDQMHMALFLGRDSGKWDKDEPLTRAEACAVFYRAISNPTFKTVSQHPNDVDPTMVWASWGYDPIMYFLGWGAISLDANANFNPDGPITMDEFNKLGMTALQFDFQFSGMNMNLTRIYAAQAIARAQGRDFSPNTNGIALPAFEDEVEFGNDASLIYEMSTDHDFSHDSRGNERWER